MDLPNLQVVLEDGTTYQYWDCSECYIAMPGYQLVVSGDGYLKFFPGTKVERAVWNPYSCFPSEVCLEPF